MTNMRYEICHQFLPPPNLAYESFISNTPSIYDTCKNHISHCPNLHHSSSPNVLCCCTRHVTIQYFTLAGSTSACSCVPMKIWINNEITDWGNLNKYGRRVHEREEDSCEGDIKWSLEISTIWFSDSDKLGGSNTRGTVDPGYWFVDFNYIDFAFILAGEVTQALDSIIASGIISKYWFGIFISKSHIS